VHTIDRLFRRQWKSDGRIVKVGADMNPPDPSLKDASDRVAKAFFGIDSASTPTLATVVPFLISAIECALLIPLLFYWRFGEVGGLGWGTTMFFVAYCLLAAIGVYFRPRTEYHTPVRLRGDWVDRIGAFWLVSCVFGPLLGWMITSAFPITTTTWQWLYALRVILAVGVPLGTALSLTRYLRGKATWVALPLLVIVTLLPIWSAVDVSRDLWEGPKVRHAASVDQPELYLPHTEQRLGPEK
jgi:hypothetical protein